MLSTLLKQVMSGFIKVNFSLRGGGKVMRKIHDTFCRNHVPFGVRRTVLSMIACMSAFLFATAALAEPKTQLEFWQTMNTEESKTLMELVAEFEKANPDIKVNAQIVPFSDAQNKYRIAAAAGDAPDVFRAEIAWIADFAVAGYLEELSSRFVEKERADFLSSAMAYGEFQGKLWAVPQATDCLALLYNKDLLAKAGAKAVPDTLEEFVALGKKLTNVGSGLYALGVSPEGYWAQTFVWAYGGDLIDVKNRKALISNAKSLSGMQFFSDLFHTHKIVSPEVDFVNGYNNMMTAFKQGKTAMIINGPWATSDVLKGTAFKKPENLGIARIPKGPAGYGSPVGGNSYVVYKGSKHKEASYKFISFLTSRDAQVRFATRHNLLPTRKSAYEVGEVKTNPILQGFKSQLEVARNRPVIPEGSRIYPSLNKAVQQVLTKSKSPQGAMKHVAKKWNKMLR